MDWLHTTGTAQIVWLQGMFKDYSSQMLFTTHLGDPRNAFLLYFPLAFFCKPSVGVQVLWVAAISEYMNAIFKWLLHGERPYWWVQETTLFNDRPHLDQFKLTCETGPGSPSGHAMVTAAVWHTMVAAFIRCNLTKLNHRTLVSGVLWSMVAVFLAAIAVSRCFISAHFPHQVVAGTVTGVLISMACQMIPKDKLTLVHYVGSAIFLLTSSLGLYWILTLAGLDPYWSIRFAKKWCARTEWIHLSTTPFNALIRDASSLIGLGLGLYLIRSKDRPKKRGDDSTPSVTYSLMGITLSLLLTQSSEYVYIPEQSPLLYYCLSAMKNTALPLLMVTVIPKICRGLITNTDVVQDDGAHKKVS